MVRPREEKQSSMTTVIIFIAVAMVLSPTWARWLGWGEER